MQKNFWIRASIKKLLTKYQIFTILPQISHFHKFRNFSSIFATFETNCFIPINFMAGTCQGILFFIFASCHPFKRVYRTCNLNLCKGNLRHWPSLQCCDSLDCPPSHDTPGKSGFTHPLTLCWTPLPQVLEQLFQVPHAPQIAAIRNVIKKILHVLNVIISTFNVMALSKQNKKKL